MPKLVKIKSIALKCVIMIVNERTFMTQIMGYIYEPEALKYCVIMNANLTL